MPPISPKSSGSLVFVGQPLHLRWIAALILTLIVDNTNDVSAAPTDLPGLPLQRQVVRECHHESESIACRIGQRV